MSRGMKWPHQATFVRGENFNDKKEKGVFRKDALMF
jgi:hypothetical protein